MSLGRTLDMQRPNSKSHERSVVEDQTEIEYHIFLLFFERNPFQIVLITQYLSLKHLNIGNKTHPKFLFHFIRMQ